MTERIDNSTGEMSLVRRGPGAAARGQGQGQGRRARERSGPRVHRAAEAPFGVKVRRRLHETTERLRQYLGAYCQGEELPLGMLVDYWA